MESLLDIFLHLITLLICSALSYGFYSFTTWAVVPASWTTEKKIDGIVLSILVGGTSSIILLCAAGSGFALIYHFLWRYRASPLGQFIARLPIVRLIPYAHSKYWLPTRASLRPRPRFFYLKRLVIRQSEVSGHFYLLNSIHAVVKIPLGLTLFYIAIMMFMFWVAILLAWYSAFMYLLEECTWYGLLAFFLISLYVVPLIVFAGARAIHSIYNGIVDYFSEAWDDFTVDVEPLEG